MADRSTDTPLQFIILSKDRTAAFIWPPGSSRPVVLEGRRILTADSPVHLYFSPSEIAAAVTRNEERRRPNASLSLWGCPRPSPEYQQCMGLIAALALFGASTAYSSFTQVISADALVAARFAGRLRVAFASFIICAVATFSYPLLPSDGSRASAFILVGCNLSWLAVGCLQLTLPLITALDDDLRSGRFFAGGLIVLLCLPFAITSLSAGISSVRTAKFKAQRACDGPAPFAAGAVDAAQAAAFLRTYDLYGGALAYVHGAKLDVKGFPGVLAAFLPAGFVYYEGAAVGAAHATGKRSFLRDAERWYTAAEELRLRALHLYAAPNSLRERVRGLLKLEKAFLRHALGKQTSSERPASPTRMDEETPLSPPETPHVAIEVTEPDGQDQGSNPSRLNENLPPA